MAMKMRQSLAELEQEFRHEMQLDRSRQDKLRRRAVSACAHANGGVSAEKRSSVRFWVLVT